MTSLDSSDASTSDRTDLRANCANCFALCCTAFGFQRSADFPIDKPAGTPCLNLTDDFSCSIHESLRARGFRGCTVFDCFGAGQYVSQNLFGGTSWKDRPDTSAEMFSAFAVVVSLGLRPRSLPAALAIAMPSRVRALIRSASNSATMPSTLNSSRPTGSVGS